MSAQSARGKKEVSNLRLKRQILGLACAVPFLAGKAFGGSLYWDGDGSGTVGGGSGTWDTSLLRWSTTSGGSTYQSWTNANNDTAIFDNAPGIVTVGASVTAGGLNFNVSSYSLIGGTITLASNPVVVTSTGTGTITSLIAGSAGLSLTGGTLVLPNFVNNTYTGGVSVGSGAVLEYGGDRAFGATLGAVTTNAITLDGGTLRADSATFAASLMTTNRGITLGTNNGTISIPDISQIQVYGGTISGTGQTLYKTGDGDLRFTSLSDSSFSKIYLAGGIVRIGSGGVGNGVEGNLGATPSSLLTDAVTFDGGSLSSLVSITTAGTRGATIGVNGGTFAQSSGISITFTGPIAGAATTHLFNAGTGLLVLTATNSFAGTLHAVRGAIIVNGTGSISGASAINLDGGTFSITNTTASSSNARIADTTAINANGGILMLEGTNSGGVNEVVGALTLGQGYNTFGVNGSSGPNKTLSFTGGITRSGRATALFSGSSLGSTSTTTIGQIGFTNDANIIGQEVGATTTYSATAKDQAILPYAVSGTSGATPAAVGFLAYDASRHLMVGLAATNYTTNTFTGGQNITANSGNTIAANTVVAVNSLRLTGTTVTFNGGVTLTITSGAVLSTTALNQFTNTSANNGTLAFGSREANFFTVTDLTLNSIVAGTGGLTKSGPGSLLLTNVNTAGNLSGSLTINSGTLSVSNATILGSGGIYFNGSGATALTTSTAVANAGNVATLSFTSTSPETLSNSVFLATNAAGTDIISHPNGTGSTTFSGKITGGVGAGSLGGSYGTMFRIDGSAGNAFRFSNSTNDFKGTIYLNNGFLDIGSNAELGDTANGLITNLGNTVGGFRFVADNVNISRRIQYLLSTPIDTQNFTSEISGTLSESTSGNTATLTKNGIGTLILSGNNQFFGGSISVAGGKLVAATNNALGSLDANTIVGTDQASAVTLAFKSATGIDYTTPEPLSLAGQGVGFVAGTSPGVGVLENVSGSNSFSGPITLNGGTNTFGMTAGSLRLRGNVAAGANSLFVTGAGNLAIDGVISGSNATSGTLFKNGTGTLTLSALNTYTGKTNILGGILSINSFSALGALPGAATDQIFINGGTLQITTTATNGASGANRQFVLGATSGTTAGTIEVPTGNSASIGGILKSNTGGSGGLAKEGAGTLILTASNLYTGPTLINGGTLSVDTFAAVGGSNTISLNGGALQVTAATPPSSTSARQFVLGPVTGTGTGTIDIPGTGSVTINGPFTDGASATGSVVKTGTGKLTLVSVSSTYKGSTKVANGTLIVGANDALPTGTTLDLGDSVAVTTGVFNTNGFNQTVAALTSSTTTSSVRNDSTTADSTLTISGSSSFGGTITDGASKKINLVKSTGGTFTLTAAQPYTGTTTISGGTLALSGSATLASPVITAGTTAGSPTVGTLDVSALSSTFTLTSSQTLKGHGTVIGPIAVAGTIAPGNSVGELTTDDETWASGGTYQWEIADGTAGDDGNGVRWDHITMGALNVTATSASPFTIKVVGAPANLAVTPNLPTIFKIAHVNGGITGGFDISKFVVDLAGFTAAGPYDKFDLVFDSGSNDLELSYVPEPSSLGLLAMCGMLARRRRRATKKR